jgi:hypothetical protein
MSHQLLQSCFRLVIAQGVRSARRTDCVGVLAIRDRACRATMWRQQLNTVALVKALQDE